MTSHLRCTFPDCLAGVPAAPPQQPVAWRVRGYAQFKTGKPGPWRYFDGPTPPSVNTPDCCDVEPVYSGPQGCGTDGVPVTKSTDGERHD